jgi:hypothetical protein
MQALRRYNLLQLLSTTFKGDRSAFLEQSGLTKGRLSQLLDKDEPFGDRAARNLEERLQLPPGYFDSMNAQTLEFATAFDALPQHVKDSWMDLVKMIGAPR